VSRLQSGSETAESISATPMTFYESIRIDILTRQPVFNSLPEFVVLLLAPVSVPMLPPSGSMGNQNTSQARFWGHAGFGATVLGPGLEKSLFAVFQDLTDSCVMNIQLIRNLL
jgi:hypothetical protein